MAPEAQHAVTWAQVAAGAGAALIFGFIISLMIPIPWVLLAAWLESRHEIKRTLAKARLLEAQNAAKAAQHDIHDCNGAMGFRRGDRGRAA